MAICQEVTMPHAAIQLCSPNIPCLNPNHHLSPSFSFHPSHFALSSQADSHAKVEKLLRQSKDTGRSARCQCVRHLQIPVFQA